MQRRCEASMTRSQNSTLFAGQRFARLIAIERVDRDSRGNARWCFKCDCGNEKVIRVSVVKNGSTQSCGCLHREISRELGRTLTSRSPDAKRGNQKGEGNAAYKHGESLPRSPEYTCWLGMIGRCTRPSDSSWKKYGARGIKVCDRWRISFANFLADMGRKPSPQHSIDRINQQGDYERCNCHWATRKRATAKSAPILER